MAIGEQDEGLCEATCLIDRAASAGLSQPCISSLLHPTLTASVTGCQCVCASMCAGAGVLNC